MYANTAVLNTQKMSEYNSIHPFHQSMDSKHKCYVYTMHSFMGGCLKISNLKNDVLLKNEWQLLLWETTGYFVGKV